MFCMCRPEAYTVNLSFFFSVFARENKSLVYRFIIHLNLQYALYTPLEKGHNKYYPVLLNLSVPVMKTTAAGGMLHKAKQVLTRSP